MQDPRFYAALSRSLVDYHNELRVENELKAEGGLRRPPMKKNSELLNSLLGLPKNILKSG